MPETLKSPKPPRKPPIPFSSRKNNMESKRKEEKVYEDEGRKERGIDEVGKKEKEVDRIGRGRK